MSALAARAPRRDRGPRWDPAREGLIAKHAPAVRRYCLARLGVPADAEDAAQDTFLRFLLSPDDIRNPEAWLIHAAQWVCADHLRRASRRPTESLETAAPVATSSDPAEIAVMNQSTAQLLERLRERDRELLDKLYVRGWSVRQVADLMAVSPGNVRIMALRARRRASDIFAGMEESLGGYSFGPFIRGLWRKGGALRQRLRGTARDAGRSGQWTWLAVDTSQFTSALVVAALLAGPAGGALAQGPPGGGATPAPATSPLFGSGPGAPGGSGGSGGNGVTAGASNPGAARADTGMVTAPELLNGTAAPPQDAPPEDVAFEYLTPSPNYERDHTAFASGVLIYGCYSTCARLYRTSDGASTWKPVEMQSRTFAGGRILLPPSYPADPTIFAIGRLGLQRSDSGGEKFRTVVPGVTAAAIDPSSPPGAARITVGGPALMTYNAATDTLTPGPALPASLQKVDAIAYGVSGQTLVVSGELAEDANPAMTDPAVLRCHAAEPCATAYRIPGAGSIALSVTRNGQGADVFAFTDYHLR
ncbi:MAG: polymerase sigma-70 factor, subfamily, partial [Chloroflexota bacterium]|nr:polymerase sigma-70 factor, subfamily [Chloroflexota bacterium]